MGAGALAMPNTYLNSGLLGGILCTIFGSIFALIALNFLLYCLEKANVKSYQELAVHCFGPVIIILKKKSLLIVN